MPSPRHAQLRRLLAMLLAASWLAGCGASSAPERQAREGEPAGQGGQAEQGGQEASAAPSHDRTFVVVGDSITAGIEEALRGSDVDAPRSWVPAAVGEPLTFLGGWATPGATIEDMREGVTAYQADVLVLMGGTNDLHASVPWDVSERNLREIVEAVGIDEVILAAVPPLNSLPAQAVEHNHRLEELAGRSGWTYVDPWTEVRQDGAYVDGASEDGVHPVPAVADQAGERIREAVLEATEG
ncbi:SGNH/GDSL hydrolase family protein [Blastococcus sp. SYSU DS0552]